MLDFKPIELGDHSILKPFFDLWQFESSELTFTNLLIWQPSHDIEYCIDNNILYIKLYEGAKLCFLPPIPGNKSMDYHCAIETVANYMREQGSQFCIRCVNTKLKELMEHCCEPWLTFIEDPANYDYVYLASDLIELKGNKYHGKRNHINKFLSEYACEYLPYEEKYFDECIKLYERWHEGRDVHPGEPRAIKTALRNYKELGLIGCVLLIGGKIEAFSMGEQITRDMAVIHIEKAMIPGAYTYINQQFAKNAWGKMTYINREEDMGIEGMRKAKMSYHPAYQIHKYTVWLEK